MSDAIGGVLGAVTGGKGSGGGDPISSILGAVAKIAEGLTGGAAA